MKYLRLLIPLVLALVVGGQTVSSATGAFGVGWNDGYFSGTPYAGTSWALVSFGTSPYTSISGLGPWGTNVTDFEATIGARLNDPTSTIDQGRAAAMIDIMLGQQGPSFGGSSAAGIAYAKANFTTWENLMQLYDSGTVPGYSVQWNVDFAFYTLPAGYWAAIGANTVANPSQSSCTPGEGCVGDLEVTSPGPDNDVLKVVKFNVNGDVWVIDEGCGCMEGTATSLAIPQASSITLTKTASNSSLGVGSTMTYGIQANESGGAPLSQFSVTDSVPAQFDPIPGSCSPGPCTISGNTVTWSFAAPADNPILTNITNGTGANLNVGVTALTPGVAITNTATGVATDTLGQNVPVNPGSATTTITGQAYSPTFHAQNSDIEAGGELCGSSSVPSPSGFVQGAATATSEGQYVVQAPGAINSVGSNDAAPDTPGDNLKLGSNGGYNRPCRPNLLAAAVAARGDPGQSVIPATMSAIDVGCLSTPLSNCGQGVIGGSNVYYYDGGDLSLSGTVHRPLTIVATAGDIEATSPIIVDNAPASAASQPSLGVIAAGSIDIDASVTEVDAYLFALGDIDTCTEADAACNQPLTVNGFLMAQQVLLRRLGSSPADPLGETVTLPPQLYLAPPPFFDTSVDNSGLSGQGERQPLF